MATRVCGQCSTMSETEGAFCPQCGAPFNAPASGPPAPARRTNGMAIASLVLSLTCCSPLGVIFGHVAHKQIRERDEDGGGLATAGLVLGYVGLALIVLYIVFVVGLVALAGE